MDKYTTFDANTEVSGRAALAVLTCTTHQKIRPYLAKHTMLDIDPDGWYPVQTWLNVLNDIAAEAGSCTMVNFISIGLKVADTAICPPGYDHLPIADALQLSQGLLSLNHRGGWPGWRSVEITGGQHITIATRVPYPDDLVYGVVYGLVLRLLPDDTSFTVRYDKKIPRRERGGQHTILHIFWR